MDLVMLMGIILDLALLHFIVKEVRIQNKKTIMKREVNYERDN